MAKKGNTTKIPGKGAAKKFVVQGATLKCSCGDRTSKLQTPGRKNVRIQNKLQANIMDFKSMKNIQPFGQCCSLANPTVAAATAANKGRLKKMPCVPNTTMPWINGKNDKKVDGAPALLENSKNCCLYGGVITITDSGQTVKKPDGDQSETKKENKDVARQIFNDWQKYWLPTANKTHLEEKALRETLRKKNPIEFGDKFALFNSGKEDALGPEYQKAYYNSQYSDMMVENQDHALNWIEDQVVKGHNPSRTEIDNYVCKYAKAEGYSEPVIAAILYFGMSATSNRAKISEGNPQIKNKANRPAAEKVEPAELKVSEGESTAKTKANRLATEKIDPVEKIETQGNKTSKIKVRRQMGGKHRYKVSCSDPVDVIAGEVMLDLQDFAIFGRMPLHWERHYGSQNIYMGLCGRGWETPGDARLEFTDDGTVLFHDGSGTPSYFDSLPDTMPVLEAIAGRLLQREEGNYTVRFKEGLTYYFPISQAAVKQIRVERVTDQSGNSLDYLYDENGLKEIRESSGRRIQVESHQGRIDSMHLYNPGRLSQILVRYCYDAKGNLTAAYDALDLPYRFVYQDNLLIQHTNRNGFAFHYEYDRYIPEGRCIHVWGDGGIHEYRLVYHDDQKMVETIGALGTTTYLYDECFRILQKTGPLGDVTKYEYDEEGRPTAVVNPDGHRTEYSYDRSGNLVKLTRPDGQKIVTEFNAAGLPVQVTDPNGVHWKHEWDQIGRLTRQISPLSAISQYRYDEFGQLTSYIDPLGAETQLSFDQYGNLHHLTNAQGEKTEFVYDDIGNLTSRIDPLQRRTNYQYDRKGRLVKAILPGGTVITCKYDAEDNLIAYQDENGAVTRLEYCGVNELKRRIQPDGQVVEYEYDREEQLVAVINQRGERYELKRDAAGRIVEEIDYWGQSRKYSYSAAGNLQESLDPLGRIIRYQTDPLGRIVAKVSPDPEGTTVGQSETFKYDANGNLIACANRELEIKRFFDLEGKLVQEDQGPNCRIAYSYDQNGNRVSRTTTIKNGANIRTQTINYSYDALGQAATVEIAGHQPIKFNRNRLGQMINEALGSKVRRFREYNDAGYLTELSVTTSSGPVFKQEYEYDGTGNLTKKIDSQYGTDRFYYDPMSRINRQIDPVGQVQQHLYDKAGDRLITAINAEKPDDPDSQWVRTGELEDQVYHFDRAGNLCKLTGQQETTEFTWDTNGRLIKSITGGQTTTYTYDPLGRRIAKETNGVIKRFFWDGDALLGDLWFETKGDAKAESVCTQVREWVYYPGSFEPLAMVQADRLTGENERIYYYANDPNGCPTRLLDENGKVVWAALYDAWGKVKRLSVALVEQPLRLQGQYFDDETGLCYNRFRYYDPEIGAFVSQDPLGLIPGEGVYGFAPNVQTWVDPLGLACKKAVLPDLKVGDKVYRVYGGDAKPSGASWSTVDPSKVRNFRNAAGLPSGGASGATNSGRFVIEGTVQDPSKVVLKRKALPLDGMKGGLPEYIIPDPFDSGAIQIDRVSGVNPQF